LFLVLGSRFFFCFGCSNRTLGMLVIMRRGGVTLDTYTHQWQRKDEVRAAIGRIFGSNLAAVGLHNALADR
jgi:hypothetical protein